MTGKELTDEIRLKYSPLDRIYVKVRNTIYPAERVVGSNLLGGPIYNIIIIDTGIESYKKDR
jgi:hypothetical protein